MIVDGIPPVGGALAASGTIRDWLKLLLLVPHQRVEHGDC